MLTLREARGKRFLTQRELAELAGVSKTTIVNIEAGSPVRPTNARKIAAALEFAPGDIDWPASNGKAAAVADEHADRAGGAACPAKSVN